MVGMYSGLSQMDTWASIESNSNYDFSAAPQEVKNTDADRRIALRPNWKGSRQVRVLVDGKDAEDGRVYWREVYEGEDKESTKLNFLALRSVSPPASEGHYYRAALVSVPHGTLADTAQGEFFFGVARGYLPEAVWVPKGETGDVVVNLKRKPVALTISLAVSAIEGADSALLLSIGIDPATVTLQLQVWACLPSPAGSVKTIGVTTVHVKPGESGELTMDVDPAQDLTFMVAPARSTSEFEGNFENLGASLNWRPGEILHRNWSGSEGTGQKLDLGLLPPPVVRRYHPRSHRTEVCLRLEKFSHRVTECCVDGIPVAASIRAFTPVEWPFWPHYTEFPVVSVEDGEASVPVGMSMSSNERHWFSRLPDLDSRLHVTFNAGHLADKLVVVRLVHPASGNWTMRHDRVTETFRLWSPRGAARIEVYNPDMPDDAPDDALPVPIFTQDVFITPGTEPQHLIVTLPEPGK
jgi:hypothetical protein